MGLLKIVNDFKLFLAYEKAVSSPSSSLHCVPALWQSQSISRVFFQKNHQTFYWCVRAPKDEDRSPQPSEAHESIVFHWSKKLHPAQIQRERISTLPFEGKKVRKTVAIIQICKGLGTDWELFLRISRICCPSMCGVKNRR